MDTCHFLFPYPPKQSHPLWQFLNSLPSPSPDLQGPHESPLLAFLSLHCPPAHMGGRAGLHRATLGPAPWWLHITSVRRRDLGTRPHRAQHIGNSAQETMVTLGLKWGSHVWTGSSWRGPSCHPHSHLQVPSHLGRMTAKRESYTCSPPTARALVSQGLWWPPWV